MGEHPSPDPSNPTRTDEAPTGDVGIRVTSYQPSAEHELEALRREVARLTERNAVLEAEEERYRLLIEGVQDYAILGLDADGLIISWNAGAQQILGYKEVEIIGRPWQQLLPAGARAALPTDGDGRSQFAGWLQRKGDGRFWAEVVVTRLTGPAHLVGFSVIVRDLTERKRLEAQQLELEHLQQLDKLKDQFLSILSHELRTPINAIMGFGSVLDDEVAGSLTAEQHQYLQKMLKGADVLLALVNDLLDMSRIQAGKFSLCPQPIDFAQVAAETLESLGPLAEQKAIRLDRELPSDLPPLRADPQRIGQVLINLVNNAIKFTPEGGRVTIAAWRDGHQVRCEIRDTGVGISPADLGKLFNPFTQLDMSATRQAGGTGLGLTIAKALVDAHGGRIGVHSQPGIGSTFWFVLPFSGPPAVR